MRNRFYLFWPGGNGRVGIQSENAVMTIRLALNMNRILRSVAALTIAVIMSTGMADSSLKLGSYFSGWDKLARTHQSFPSAERLIIGYANQVGHSCFSPELFHRGGSTSLLTAKLYYDMGLPIGATERVLLDSYDQRVAMISRRIGSDVLAVLVSGTSGVFLILC